MSMPDLTRERLIAAIEPRSDQINYEDMIAGPRDVEVAGVSAGTKEQPVQIRLAGEARYYRPCKTMTRLLVALWGDDGRAWVGRRLRLVGDPNVMFGGVRVGGIRISHASHIDTAHTVALSVARGKRAPHTVQPLVTRPEPDAAPPLAAAPGKATARGTPRQGWVGSAATPPALRGGDDGNSGGGAPAAEPSSPAKTPIPAPPAYRAGETGRESTPETAAAPGRLCVWRPGTEEVVESFERRPRYIPAWIDAVWAVVSDLAAEEYAAEARRYLPVLDSLRGRVRDETVDGKISAFADALGGGLAADITSAG